MEEKYGIVDSSVRRELAVAQDWICAASGDSLVAGAVAVVFASSSEGGPAYRAPVLVNESCAEEQRTSLPDFADAHRFLCRTDDARAAEDALKAAIAVQRNAVDAVVEKATAPLRAKLEALEDQVSGLTEQKTELELSIAKLSDGYRKLQSNRDAYAAEHKKETALRKKLEQRIVRLLEAIKDPRAQRNPWTLLAIVRDHLRPEQVQEKR